MKPLNLRSPRLQLSEAVKGVKNKTISSSQLARRVLAICNVHTSDYDVFDAYMKTYGRLTDEPALKPNIRLVIVSLLEQGLLVEDSGKYVASTEALHDVSLFSEYDHVPETVFEARAAAAVSLAKVSLSTSTSTSCDCTSSSSSSAVGNTAAIAAANSRLFASVICVSRLL